MIEARPFVRLISAFLLLSLASSKSTCDLKLYGKVNDHDCFALYEQLPAEPGQDLDEPHSFVEPKFLSPPFTPVWNPFKTEMIQLPKIWRYRTALRDPPCPMLEYLRSLENCRYALLSVADEAGVVHEPTSVDKWKTTLNVIIDTVQDCVLETGGAGGMQYANSKLTSLDL